MNTVNNAKKRRTFEKVEKAFLELIQTKELNEICVTDLVKKAEINRSTFYANFLDIYDLADKVKEKMFFDYLDLFPEEKRKQQHSYNYLPLFCNIKENQIFYRTLFKLGFDFLQYYDKHLEEDEAFKYYGTNKNMDYHIEFFKAGITAIIKKWLNSGCVESPEEINDILISEYKNPLKIES